MPSSQHLYSRGGDVINAEIMEQPPCPTPLPESWTTQYAVDPAALEVAATAPPRGRQRQQRYHIPQSPSALRRFVERHRGLDAVRTSPPVIVQSRYCSLRQLRDALDRPLFEVRNSFVNRRRSYRSYSAAAAHFRALFWIELQGYSRESRDYGSQSTFYLGQGRVTISEFPRVRSRCRAHYSVPELGITRAFRTFDALSAWSEWRNRHSPGVRAQRFEQANYIDWTQAGNFSHSPGSPPSPKVFDAVYISHSKDSGLRHRLKRLRLKSRNVTEAMQEFTRIALKRGYVKISLLQAKPDGEWRERYKQEAE